MENLQLYIIIGNGAIKNSTTTNPKEEQCRLIFLCWNFCALALFLKIMQNNNIVVFFLNKYF